MLRIRQTGLNSNNHHYLACSGLEVYGKVFNASQPDLVRVRVPHHWNSPPADGALWRRCPWRRPRWPVARSPRPCPR
jgi:hypothetical protein